MFKIEFSNQSKKFLKKCDKQLANRIVEKISLLKTDPVPHKSISVIGEDRIFRIRIGDYRILYEINWNDNIILTSKIDKRPRVYGK